MRKLLKQYLEIGKITSPHGVKGEVKLEIYADSPEALKKVKTVYFDKNGEKPIEVESARPHKDRLLIKLKGVNSMDDGNTLRGKVLYAHRDSIIKDKNSIFIEDLKGVEVTDIDSGVSYGRITDIIATGANDVYVIKDGEKERLIPAIKDVVIETDIEAGIMKIRPLRGLFDED